jgi:hypothetical protein
MHTCAFCRTSLNKIQVNNTHFYGIVILQILAQFFEPEVSFGHGTVEGRIACLHW